MPRFFLDSSALVKRYVIERGTDRIVELLEGTEPLVASRLTLVEVTATVVRRAKGGDLAAHHLETVLPTLEREFRARFEVIELARATLTRSADLIRVHALRAADGIQLACALIGAGPATGDDEFIFVSSDSELNGAAEKEGLTVLDPQQSEPS